MAYPQKGRGMTMRSLALSIIALVFPLQVFPALAQDENLPSEIEQYYEDYSFVAAFSTPGEQYRLMRFSSAEEVKEETGSERLSRVYAALERLRARELEADPQMALPPPEEWVKLYLTPQIITRSDTTVSLKVTGFRVSRDAVDELISEYEQRTRGAAPDPIPTEPGLMPLKDFHHWVQVGEHWYKEGHVLRKLPGV